MKIIDISWPITNGTTEYKDRNNLKINSTIIMHPHTGTHVDAPAHFTLGGKTVEQLEPDQFIGHCRVVDLTNIKEKITAHDLKLHTIKYNEIILFKTKNSALKNDAPFNPEFIYLDKTGAKYCVEQKVKAIGIDYLGIERNQPGHETHALLLENNVGIIEGLRLEHVEADDYFLICLPLLIQSADASPARAILLPSNVTSQIS